MNSVLLILSLFLLVTNGYSNELPPLKILAMEQLSKSIDALPTAALRMQHYKNIKDTAGSLIDNKEYCYKNFEDYYFKTRRWNYVWQTSQSRACDVQFVQINEAEDKIVTGDTMAVIIWDIQGNLKAKLDYSIPITALAINSDGNTIVTGHANGYVGCAVLKDDEQAGIALDNFFTCEQSTAPIIAINYLDHITKIVSACKSGSVRLWRSNLQPRRALDTAIPDVQSMWCNDKVIYVNSGNNDVYKLDYDKQSKTVLKAHLMPLKASALAQRDNKIICLGPSQLTIFNTKKNKHVCGSLVEDNKVFNSLSNAAIADDGVTALFGSEADGLACLNVVMLYGNRIHNNSFRRLTFQRLHLDENLFLKKQIKKIALGKTILAVLCENKIENETEFYNSYRTIEVYKSFSLEQILNYTKPQHQPVV
ncbi:hypothetical protein Noda2021_04220 [Candidatus Dependentiae bacterium Noda2021]|nr:hypothetical protein Noda2021_04220 [Candidatus Dependentiae bacterium Noda2021]